MAFGDEIIAMITEAKRMPAPVGEKSHLYADLGFDSLSFIELLLRIEDKYDITFDIAEMADCLEVAGLIALTGKKLRERNTYD